MRRMNTIILHHSGTEPKAYEADLDGSMMSKNICSAHYRNWAREFPDYVCDYHYLIGPTGTVFEGQPLDKPGWHCGNYEVNFKSIGICLLGNFEEIIPPLEQVNALIDLLVKLVKDYDIKTENIKRHKDVAPTLCPGKNFPYRFILDTVQIKRTEVEISDEDVTTESEEAIKFVLDNDIMKPPTPTQVYLEQYFEEPVTHEELAIFLYRFKKLLKKEEMEIIGESGNKNWVL